MLELHLFEETAVCMRCSSSWGYWFCAIELCCFAQTYCHANLIKLPFIRSTCPNSDYFSKLSLDSPFFLKVFLTCTPTLNSHCALHLPILQPSSLARLFHPNKCGQLVSSTRSCIRLLRGKISIRLIFSFSKASDVGCYIEQTPYTLLLNNLGWLNGQGKSGFGIFLKFLV